MKIFTFFVFTLISLAASSQCTMRNEESGIAVGLSGGYASNQLLTGNFSIGAQFADKIFSGQNHFSVNLQIFSNPSKVGTPVVFEGRLGHVINNTLEIYGGYGYHKAKTDASENKSGGFASGFKPAYGIIKKSKNSWWTVAAGMSGNVFSLQLGIFAIR